MERSGKLDGEGLCDPLGDGTTLLAGLELEVGDGLGSIEDTVEENGVTHIAASPVEEGMNRHETRAPSVISCDTSKDLHELQGDRSHKEVPMQSHVNLFALQLSTRQMALSTSPE